MNVSRETYKVLQSMLYRAGPAVRISIITRDYCMREMLILAACFALRYTKTTTAGPNICK